MFQQVNTRVDFPTLERDILQWWDDNDVPRKYRERNDQADKRYSFIDGPITANNPMGVHHAWGRTYKDLFLRFRNMQGYKQRFQNGFDGQGLWIEVEVEKELGFKSKRDIEAYGIDKFVDLCKERVRRFSDVISNQSKRLAYWMDWDDSYHTMADENNYTIWQFLKRCHERGWLYEGRDVMPWCPRCGTGLSEHEIVTEGYKEVVHPGLFVRFPLLDEDASLLVWTTTPWTLTSNVAAAVHPEKTYVKASNDGESLYLAKALLPLLRGETTLTLRADAVASSRSRTSSSAKTRDDGFEIAGGDQALWDALRECRLRLADEASVPPYVVFHDATLKEFVRLRPSSREAMLQVHGVGQAKLDRYAEPFLEVIAAHPAAASSTTPG